MSAVFMDNTGGFARFSLLITYQQFVSLLLIIFQSVSILDFFFFS